MDKEDQKNISLKEEHTHNVCKNMIEITKELYLNDNDMMLAETIALFHDIGRFPQYAKYKTFRDRKSVNHGFLGAETLLQEKILQPLSDNEQELVIRAIRFHNAYSIPKAEKEDVVFFLKLIRDADKLDILRVFIEYYEMPEEERASAVGLGLADTAGYSEDVLSCILRGKMATLSQLKSMNDFKLMHLSWIYDINLRPSFRLLSERNYIDKIVSQLPQDERIQKASSVLKEYVRKKVEET
jgi:hypothetical protein